MKIQIFGERHSGTKFVADLCRHFLDAEVRFRFGHKHFFTIDAIKEKKKLIDDTLFICVVRNPYSWLNGMWTLPYHAGNKNKKRRIKLLTEPWWSVNRLGNKIETDVHIYNNRTYLNLFELRSCKLLFLKYTLPKLVSHQCLIRTECFLDTQYINVWLSDISNTFNIRQKGYYNPELNMKFVRGSNPITNLFHTPDILKMVNNNLDWNLENAYNYYPIYNYNQPNTDLQESVYEEYKNNQEIITNPEKRQDLLGSKIPLDN